MSEHWLVQKDEAREVKHILRGSNVGSLLQGMWYSERLPCLIGGKASELIQRYKTDQNWANQGITTSNVKPEPQKPRDRETLKLMANFHCQLAWIWDHPGYLRHISDYAYQGISERTNFGEKT